MKKYFIILMVLFWSMIFPNLSLNSLTTDITVDDVHYSDFMNQEFRKELLKNAEFGFFLFQ